MFQCLVVLECEASIEGRESFVISFANSIESETYVWGYGDDVIGLRSGLEGGLPRCFSASHGIFSGCLRCAPYVITMPPRQRMRC